MIRHVDGVNDIMFLMCVSYVYEGSSRFPPNLAEVVSRRATMNNEKK